MPSARLPAASVLLPFWGQCHGTEIDRNTRRVQLTSCAQRRLCHTRSGVIQSTASMRLQLFEGRG